MGVRCDNEKNGDIILPPWAKTPQIFIALNRLALESNYVSQHINDWIDLIFGYKLGKLEYNNLFPSFIYTEKLDKITEDIQNCTMNFGTSPNRLFTEKHPQRYSAAQIAYMNSSIIKTSGKSDLQSKKHFHEKAILKKTSKKNGQ